MEYISRFIQVPVSEGRTASIDVTSITLMVKPNTRYSEGLTKVYHHNDGHIEVTMSCDELTALVDERRKLLWEQEQKANAIQTSVMVEILKAVTPVQSITADLSDPQGVPVKMSTEWATHNKS